MVGFYDNHALAAKAAISSGQAKFTSSTLTQGTHQVTAVYWGDANFGQATARTTTVVGASTPAPCPLSTTSPSVTICAPTQGQLAASPVRVVAGTTSSSKVVGLKIYVDGLSAYSATNVASLDTSLPLAPGAHRVVVKAWNSGGEVFSSTRSITVVNACSASPATAAYIKVCSPTSSGVLSPVLVAATAYDPAKTISATAVYVDYKLAQKVSGKTLYVSVPLSAGAHHLTVQSWNSAGEVMKKSVDLTVK